MTIPYFLGKTKFKRVQMSQFVNLKCNFLSFKGDFIPHNLFRFVDDLKRPVLEVLEECVWDENSRLFQLKGFWDSGVKVQSPKYKILEELEGYWRKLARQGRSLEEAAR